MMLRAELPVQRKSTLYRRSVMSRSLRSAMPRARAGGSPSPVSVRAALFQIGGELVGQFALANGVRHRLDVVGHANEFDRGGARVENRVAGVPVAILRFAHRPDIQEQ